MRPIGEYLDLLDQRTRLEVTVNRADEDRYQIITIALVVVTVLFSILAFFHIRKRLIAPIVSLSTISARIQSGAIDERAMVTSADEVGTLASAFNRMVESLQFQISERKRSENLAIRLGSIVEQSLNEVFIFDAQTLKIIDANYGACSNLGYTLNEMQKLTALDLKPKFTPETFEQVIRPLRNGENEIIIFNAVHKRKDGSLYDVEEHLQLMHQQQSPVFVAIIQDITERNAMEEALRRAQRMEAVGQLTGGIAHDFNNLMGVIIGNAEMLRNQVGQNESARRRAEAIVKSVKRGASLTERLLAFSRQQILSPEPTAINDLILGLENMLHRTLGETVELSLILGPGICKALIDPHQFENALVNLSINARDAMPKGGVLTIETANITLDDNYAAQYEEVLPGDYVKIAVSDTGTGMLPETLQKAFEPFFTTKEVGEGSGLGLSMVYGFAKQSDGHVTITSQAGHGTTIELYLPRSEEVVAREEAKDETPESRRGSERILIVEDDEAVREIPTSMLRDHGYEVAEAGDGEEAIKCLQDGQAFDLLFTDIVLPGGMNGLEIAEEAKRIQPNIKVLFTSGYPENTLSHGGKLDKEVTLLNKPYLRTTLLEKVRAVLDGAND